MMKQIAPTPLQRQGMERMEQRLDALLHDPVMPVPGYGVMAFDRGGLVCQRYGGLARIEPGAPGGGTPGPRPGGRVPRTRPRADARVPPPASPAARRCGR